jgi:hypothetical protein
MNRLLATRLFIRVFMTVVFTGNAPHAQSHEDAVGAGGVGMATATAPKTNPALLGLARPPAIGLTLPSVWAGYWSDRLALTPYKKLIDIGADSTVLADYIDAMLDNSFGTGACA